MFDLVIDNAIVVSAANGWEPYFGCVAANAGVLEYCGERRISPPEAHTFVDAEGGILMPGLFNGHCHAELSFLKGIGDGMTLLEQKQVFGNVGWFLPFCTEEERYAARQHTYCEALLSGTTFLNDNMYWSLGERSADAMLEIGIRGALSEDVRPDFSKPDAFSPPEKMQALFSGFSSKGFVPVAASIAEEDYSTERLQSVKKLLIELGAAVRTTFHFSETPWRIKSVLDRFEKTPTDVLEHFGLLNERCIASHAVYLSESDIMLIAKRGVHIVNTPLCEMKIADGIAPVGAMMRAGISVSLGTDGPLWNNSSDVFREMKGMLLLQTVNDGIRTLGIKDVLNMATVNGAAAFGLQDRVGVLKPGMEADMILLSSNSVHLHPLRLGKFENVTSTLVFSATGSDVRDVFIRGKQVVKNRLLLSVDSTRLMNAVEETGNRVTKELEKIDWCHR